MIGPNASLKSKKCCIVLYYQKIIIFYYRELTEIFQDKDRIFPEYLLEVAGGSTKKQLKEKAGLVEPLKKTVPIESDDEEYIQFKECDNPCKL